MKNKLIGIGLALTLLLAGAVTGVVIDRNWGRGAAPAKAGNGRTSRGGDRHERMLQRFRKRLQLTDAQVEAVSKIIRGSRANMRSARIQAREDIKKLLNPDQVKKYERMIERRRKRRQQRGGRRGR